VVSVGPNVWTVRELHVIAPDKTKSDRSGGRRFVIVIIAALTAAPAAFATDTRHKSGR